jgi:hypothetical protein
VVDLARGQVTDTLRAGHTATAPVLGRDGQTLFVCSRFNHEVSVLDLLAKKEHRRIRVQREPVAADLTRDGRFLLVANHLHNGRADTGSAAAVVSVVDISAGQVVQELSLPPGSGLLQDLRVSPDGRFAVVTHVLARFHLPTTQLERGWVNTNAKTLIDLANLKVLNTVLLDNVDRGAANPWGVAWSTDGARLCVAIAGTHEVSITDFPALLAKLARLPDTLSPDSPNDYSSASRVKAEAPNDLAFLAGLRQRIRLPETDRGPRALAVVGNTLYAANYFSDTLSAVDLAAREPAPISIPLGPQTPMTAVRKGEFYFHDASICFQGWQSCASCHPGDGRVDALNWDLLNDGLGNPKNNKSLLLSHRTPPAMSTGVRETAETAVRAGIEKILMTVQPGEVAAAIDEYLKDLKPVPSPYLVNGRFSPAAQRGQRIFNDRQVGCARCHAPGLFTDLKSYDVGTAGSCDKPNEEFDTPTLIEVWRTAPYLHDGSATTLRGVLTDANRGDRHGKTSHLTPEQLEELAAYVLSL